MGLDAQRAAVQHWLEGAGGELLAEYTEVETGKGANALHRRPQLRLALDQARR